jgi:hypothetical protein
MPRFQATVAAIREAHIERTAFLVEKRTNWGFRSPQRQLGDQRYRTLKFLPDDVACDPHYLGRFKREAHTVPTLQTPSSRIYP